MRRLALTAILLSTPDVALASPGTPNGTSQAVSTRNNRALAVTLSEATPAVLIASIWAANILQGLRNYGPIDPVANLVLVDLAPFGFSAGYYYAGEPLRGTLVGLGGAAITTAGFTYLNSLGGGQASLNQLPIVGPLMFAGLVGYGVWVAQDLQHVLDGKNAANK